MSLVRSSCSSSRCPRLDLLYGVEGLQRAELLLSAPLGSHSPGQLQPCAPPFDPPHPTHPFFAFFFLASGVGEGEGERFLFL